MAMARRNEGSKITSDINVTPMTDVMLVLLIIFMVITPLLGPGIHVNMATANNAVAMPDAQKEDALLVALTHDGRIYLGTEQVRPDQLTGRLKDRLQRSHDNRVFLKADAHVKYGVVLGVVDNIRSADVQDLGLLTERNTRMVPPPAADIYKKVS